MSKDESQRPWGRYEILSEGHSHKVKTIWVNPGKRLSYQRHEKRAEHWFIVQGDARITLNNEPMFSTFFMALIGKTFTWIYPDSFYFM